MKETTYLVIFLVLVMILLYNMLALGEDCMENNNEELEMIYKELYLTYGNSEKYIDYELLVKQYAIYLSLFLNKESSFYHDLQFLLYVIEGFKYCHNTIYDDVSVDVEEMYKRIAEEEVKLVNKVAKESKEKGKNENFRDSDLILYYSCEVVTLLQVMGLASEYNDALFTLVFNTYVVEEKTDEKGTECMKSGMEYWKRNN